MRRGLCVSGMQMRAPNPCPHHPSALLQLGRHGDRVTRFMLWAGNNKGRETIPGVRHFSTVDATVPRIKPVDGLFDDWKHYDKKTPLLETPEGRPIYRPVEQHHSLAKERGRWEMATEYLQAPCDRTVNANALLQMCDSYRDDPPTLN